MSAATMSPAIAHDGRGWRPWVAADAATGVVRWCFAFGLGCVVVVGVDAETVGSGVVWRAVLVARRCFCGFW